MISGTHAAGDCPSEIVWVDLLEGRVSGPGRDELLDHLEACSACAALWAFLCGLEETPPAHVSEPAPADIDGEPFDHSSPHPEQHAGRRDLLSSAAGWLVAAAAMAMLVLFLVMPPAPIRGGGAERWRGPAASLSTRATIEDGRVSLGWEAWPTADSYRVRVWSPDGDVVALRVVPATELSWPLPQSAARDAALLWAVEALRRGQVVAASPVNELDLRRSAESGGR